ncbi:MAG: 1-deoxy-D-xylulose-5-phosphate synthase [Clostridiales bacterium]|nr:1-deoxy-D-xylulose-5-phosphate synthase [Clostridiales bacterium]
MLEKIKSPSDLKKLNIKQLKQLAEEIRREIIDSVSENGGHLASNLGVVELTLAIHYVFDTPEDKLVMDVGHQAYAHKLLTGRYESFKKLRTRGGTSGFPQMEESEYDAFTAGHASTAISAALGMARTRDIMHGDYNVVAMVGDGALSGGMCYEALNDAGNNHTKMVVILNDNAMSIAPNVGAMSNYLTHLRQSKGYRGFKRGVRRWLGKIPVLGNPIFRFIEKFRDALKSLFVDGRFFDALGFEYIGPIDGHDLKHMIRVLKRTRDTEGPVLVHVVTQKGKGYKPAETRPDVYHGVAPFFVDSGAVKGENGGLSCGKVVSRQLADMAETDIRICAVTAAMPTGTGLSEFQKIHPDRFFDVGIAEEHAVTMAAGMASLGMKPYVGIYSTFLQRSYDQIMMDVCRNSLPVTLLIDRAGFVGADGSTHQGVMDLSYLRSMPNMIVAAPRDVRDLKKMLSLSQEVDAPMAIRYPKDSEDLGPGIQSQRQFAIGEWELISDGSDIMIFAVGRMVQKAMQASIELMGKGISAGVMDARFVKPMDEKKLIEYAKKAKLVVTIEENVLAGGFGEGVLNILSEKGVRIPVMNIGVPDRFVEHGSVSQQLEECGMDEIQIARRIIRRYHEI